MNTTQTRTVLILGALVLIAGGFGLGILFRDHEAVDNEASPSPTVSVSVSSTPTPKPVLHTVHLTAQGPQPANLFIRSSDVVSFINEGIAASYWLISSDCGVMNSGRGLQRGDRYELTFTATGTCTYFNRSDSYNSTARGTITIQ